jgi:hypothetical protein
MAQPARHYGSDANPPHHRTEHVGTRPSSVLPREGFISLPSTVHKGILWRCRKGKAGLQGHLHPGWHSAPRLLAISSKRTIPHKS